ncbi:MAG: asparagine synthase (glutamine-hydrolyzing) [Bacteroidia bacterium]
MCGIAAIINPTSQAKTEMEFMLKKIEHRGDTAPVQIQLGNSLLGSVRLKIVDSQNGSQPFFNEHKTIGIVFNGEIYNYKKLKSELEAKGHHFISDCDTEVLVHLYEEYGTNFLLQLEGMFSFFIFDSNQNSFFGARDFFGVKPFFYCKNKSTIYISSEIKSFIDLEVETFEELKPGHYLTDEGVYQYYKTASPKWIKYSNETIASEVRDLIEESVKKRVQTDLPIATFLSGGLDSSIIHLLCCKFHSDVTALIVGEDSGEDVIYAKRLCNDLNLKFYHIKTNEETLLQNVPEVIYSIETFEPNPVRGSLLSMKLGELAHEKGFKIVLCGEGSDEVLGGYGDFLFLKDEKEFQNEIENLLNDLYRTQLLRIDKTGMKYAVEVREPFLDRNFVEYALNIHPSLKVAPNSKGKMTTKFILREAFKDLLPDYIYSREKMTLMEGAGIGGVEKGKGLLFQYANAYLSDQEFKTISDNYSNYRLKDKEEAYCFKFFNQYFSKAKFAKTRVINAQKEILKPNEH